MLDPTRKKTRTEDQISMDAHRRRSRGVAKIPSSGVSSQRPNPLLDVVLLDVVPHLAGGQGCKSMVVRTNPDYISRTWML